MTQPPELPTSPPTKTTTNAGSTLPLPLIYAAALLLLVEDWLWDTGLRAVSALAAWPPVHQLELRIQRLRPYPALCIFLLPALMLFPVKIFAVFAMAQGHGLTGLCIIVAAKLGGAALVARLYHLTRPSLMTLPWFKHWHDKFVALKRHWVARLKDTDTYRLSGEHARRLHGATAALLTRLRSSEPTSGRHGSHPVRVVRRLLAMWRARR